MIRREESVHDVVQNSMWQIVADGEQLSAARLRSFPMSLRIWATRLIRSQFRSVSVLCVALSIGVPEICRAETEQDVCARLQRVGAVIDEVALEDGSKGWAVSLDYVDRDPSLWLRDLSRLNAVFELNLRSTPTNDWVIQQMAQFPSLSRLRKLDLTRTRVTHVGFTALREFTELRELIVSHMYSLKFRTDEFRPLFSCSSLESLDLTENGLTPVEIDGIERLSRLQELSVNSSRLGDALVPHVLRLPRLHALTIQNGGGGRALTDAGIIELVTGLTAQTPDDTPPPLRKLRLLGHPIGDKAIQEGVSKLTNLRVLEIVGGDIGDEGIRAISTLSEMENLKLFGRTCSPEALRELAHLRKLRRLILTNTTVTDDVLREYASLTELRSLGLWLCVDITDAGIAHLLNYPRLEELNLDGAKKLTDACTETLAKLPSLKRLAIGNTRITDAGLHHLGQMEQLTQLDFRNISGLTRAGLVELKGLKSLEMLNLSGMELADGDLAILAEFPGLQGLELSSPKLSDAGLMHLLKMTELRQLYVFGSSISSEGMRRLYSSLPQCDPVRLPWLAW